MRQFEDHNCNLRMQQVRSQFLMVLEAHSVGSVVVVEYVAGNVQAVAGPQMGFVYQDHV